MQLAGEGLSFRVSAERGVSGNNQYNEVDNPIFTLHPYRCFPEAFEVQPAAEFLLTLQVPPGEGDKAVRATLEQCSDERWLPPAAQVVGDLMRQELLLAAKRAGGDGWVLPTVVC